MYRSILAAAVLVLSAGALADDASPAPVPAGASTSVPVPAAAPAGCPQDTGSRLPRHPGDCLSLPGRSYGRDELGLTGASNAQDALRNVDPSVITTR
ncbi:MAG: hypothetical protein JWR07_4801 [Nevskia sp.]|nr:hypothetical protein [Nevskia sp.]